MTKKTEGRVEEQMIRWSNRNAEGRIRRWMNERHGLTETQTDTERKRHRQINTDTDRQRHRDRDVWMNCLI